MDEFGIRADQRKIVDAILLRHAPASSRVWAFGSRVRGKSRKYSDLDLAIDAGRPLAIGDTSGLEFAFEESSLPWRVDIVDLASCSERFRKEVESHAVLVLDVPAEARHPTASAGDDR